MAEIALVRFVHSEWLRYGKENVVGWGNAVYANISLINSQTFNGLSRGGRGVGEAKAKKMNCIPVCFGLLLQYSEHLYRSQKTTVTHV